MVAATLSLPEIVEELPDKFEMVDGQIQEVSGMGASEAFLATMISWHLLNWCFPRKAGRVVVEALFSLDAQAGLRRRPDVAYISSERWPYARPIPHGETVDVIPSLAIEVVSPTNSMNEIMDKIADYFSYGVDRVWICLPRQQIIQVYSSPISSQGFGKGDVLRDDVVFPGLELALDDLFEKNEE